MGKASERDKIRMNERAKAKRKVAPLVKSKSGTRPHRCRECHLIFTAEDAREGLFFASEKICVRCKSIERMNALNLPLPDCFGVSYDGGNDLCARRCQLRRACRIQISDAIFREKPYHEKVNKRQTYRSHLIRIFRALGRPAHLHDIAPTMERETMGDFKMDPEGIWEIKLRRACTVAPELIALGGNFFVWEGCWDITQGGVPGRSDSRRRENEGHMSIQEIMRRLEEEGAFDE